MRKCMFLVILASFINKIKYSKKIINLNKKLKNS